MTDITTLPNPVKDLVETVALTIEKWKRENTEKIIEQKVMSLLDKNAKEVVTQLLGFKKDYDNRMELDHCNGRNGNSAAGDYMRKVQQEAINTWLAKVELPALTATDKKNIASSMKGDYLYAYKQKLKELVLNKANADAKEVFDSITSMQPVVDYFKIVELINPTDTTT